MLPKRIDVRRFLAGLSVLSCLSGECFAADDRLPSAVDLYFKRADLDNFVGTTAQFSHDTMLSTLMRMPRPTDSRSHDLRLNLRVVLAECIDLARDIGIPLHNISDASGKQTVGVSTSLRVYQNLPAVELVVRESNKSQFGAF